jgi:hypothetical protein
VSKAHAGQEIRNLKFKNAAEKILVKRGDNRDIYRCDSIFVYA